MRVSTEVLSVLDRAACDGNALSLVALGKLDPRLYAATNKVLEAAGGKWNRKARAHLFDRDAAAAIEPIILTGEAVSTKQELQQFDTPPGLAAGAIAAANIAPGMTVLEPSIGLGNLAMLADIHGGLVTGYEIDLSRSCRAHKAVPNARITLADFLKVEPKPHFDRVVMNPPFAGQADIRHVLHAAKFLRAGGRLVAIMSAGITFRRNRLADEFRAFLDLHRALIVDLPDGSFRASGTDVRAVLVSFDAIGAAA